MRKPQENSDAALAAARATAGEGLPISERPAAIAPPPEPRRQPASALASATERWADRWITRLRDEAARPTS